MATTFQIKKGLKANLPEIGIEGCWYLTTDSGELFVFIAGAYVKVNETEPFDPTEINSRISSVEEDVTSLDERVETLEAIDTIIGGTSAD